MLENLASFGSLPPPLQEALCTYANFICAEGLFLDAFRTHSSVSLYCLSFFIIFLLTACDHDCANRWAAIEKRHISTHARYYPGNTAGEHGGMGMISA